jgi:hypothetical protein
MQIWFLWFKHRWQAISALGIALMALLLVVLMISGTSTFGMTLLGNASAPRAGAADGPSGTVLPRSSDPNQSTSALPNLNASLLDQSVAADSSPHTIAEAQAAWSATEIERHQTELLAAFNCVRGQQKLPVMTLDAQLSATAGAAWLRLAHDPSFSLMNLPDQYQWRSIMPLPSGMQATAGAPGQGVSTASSSTAVCSAATFDVSIVPAASVATRIGIAVFPPQASWDMASAVILVQ